MTAPREARPVTDRHRERARAAEMVVVEAPDHPAGLFTVMLYAADRAYACALSAFRAEGNANVYADAVRAPIAAALADAEPGGREAREEARPRCPTEHRWACPDCGTEILDTYEWEDAENERLRAVVEAARTVSLQAMPHALKVALAALSSAPVEARPVVVSAVEGEREGLASAREET